MTEAIIQNGVCGRYWVRVDRYSEDDVYLGREDTGWFSNLITNNGLDMLGQHTITDCVNEGYVGTNNTAPTNADTQLGTLLYTTTDVGGGGGSATASAPYYNYRTFSCRWGKGVAQGTLKEVGVGRAFNDLLSHALIVDAGGNPTSITVGNKDILTLYYEFRVYIEHNDVTWSDTVNGQSYSGVMRPVGIQYLKLMGQIWMAGPGYYRDIGVYGGDIGAINGQPSNSNGRQLYGPSRNSYNAGTDFIVQSYTPGNYYRDITYKFGLNMANFASNLGAFKNEGFIDGSVGVQMSFNPNLPKDATKTWDLTLRTTWARYTPP